MTVAAEGLFSGGRGKATIALMIATAMQACDATIVNVALPQLQQGLGGGIGFGAWVITSYLCASAVMAPLTGFFRRRYGPRRLFAGAIVVFVCASMLAAIAPSASAMILFRLTQGAAAGLIQPLAQAILLDIHPEQDHGRILAMWGATIMIGPILGPVLGGLITDLASWRWIFGLNMPLGIIALLGLQQIPSSVEGTDGHRIDAVGVLLLLVGVGALQLCLQRSFGLTWPPALETIVETAVAMLAFAAILIRSRRSRFTLFRFEIFRNLNFAVSIFYNFMVSGLLFTTIVFLPALSEGPLGYNATHAGLAISPRGLGTMAMILGVGYLIDRVDQRALLVSGLAISAVALELMARVPPDNAAPWLAVASAIQGVGVGLLFTPLSVLAFSRLDAGMRTDAAGIYSLLRQLGSATGVALMTVVLQIRVRNELASLGDQQPSDDGAPLHLIEAERFAAYTSCFRTMAIATAILIPGVFLFRVLRSRSDVPNPDLTD